MVNFLISLVHLIHTLFNTTRLRWSSFVRSPLEGTIPCLEFTIEIQSNSLMYNPNKEIRNREFPIKIGKFSVRLDLIAFVKQGY